MMQVETPRRLIGVVRALARACARAGVRAAAVTLGLLLSLPGCGDNDLIAPPEMPAPPEPLLVRQVDWNGQHIPLGQVAALAEQGEDLIILSDLGALLFSNGQLQASDVTIRAWRQGAVITAADLSGTWLAGIDAEGRVRRLRNRSVMDDVSARYGLDAEVVRALCPLGGGKVAFLLDEGLLVADTAQSTLSRYEGRWRAVAGHEQRVALLGTDAVLLLDLAQKESLDLMVRGPTAVAFDPQGRLLVTTATELLREEGTALRSLHRFAGRQARALATAGRGVWIADGDRLAVWTDVATPVRTTGEGRISNEARILPAPGGDVWVLSEGAPLRFSETGVAGDQELWQRTVLPTYQRVCSVCHDPGASSLIDLSTYAAWSTRRQLMEQRVVRGKPTPMPPAGTGALTPAEMEQLTAWIEAGK